MVARGGQEADFIAQDPVDTGGFGGRGGGNFGGGGGGFGGGTIQPGKNVFIKRGRGGGSIIDRRDLGVSMGKRNPLEGVGLGPGAGVPAIRQPGRRYIGIPVTKVIGNGPAPVPQKLSPPKTTLPKLPPQILNPPIIPNKKTKGVLDVLIDIIKPKVQPMPPFDLGNILTTIGGDYINARWGNRRPTTPVYDPQGFNPWSNVPLDQRGYVGPAEVEVAGGNGTCLAPGYKYDKCGNVVKVRRRRRRRLATSSDIKDLAALSSVTTGPEKKTWIATHPS